uniref:Uncharacterized protein n=1 Tax=Arundo donax TaxID=35708 RepID=A0A0A9D598_ARUDO
MISFFWKFIYVSVCILQMYRCIYGKSQQIKAAFSLLSAVP